MVSEGVSVGKMDAFNKATQFDKFIRNINDGFLIDPSECHDIASKVSCDFASMKETEFCKKYKAEMRKHDLNYNKLTSLVADKVIF